MKHKSIPELRALVDLTDPRQAQMLAAIDAVAALVGDDHKRILATLMGAYVTVAVATGNGDEILRIAVSELDTSRRELRSAYLVATDTPGRGESN